MIVMDIFGLSGASLVLLTIILAILYISIGCLICGMSGFEESYAAFVVFGVLWPLLFVGLLLTILWFCVIAPLIRWIFSDNLFHEVYKLGWKLGGNDDKPKKREKKDV